MALNTKNEVNICFCTDNNYSSQTTVAIASILKNSGKDEQINIYILESNDIKDEYKQKIRALNNIRKFKVEFFKINAEKYKNLYTSYHITLAAYYRLLISELLADLDKVIYLDCDVIVKTSLLELYKEDIEDYYLAGVQDFYMNEESYSVKEVSKRKLNLYINSGVLLINIKKWKADKISEKLLNLAKKYTEDVTSKKIHDFGHDQDVINFGLAGHIKPLDLKYNVPYHILSKFHNPTNREINVIKKPAIIHFLGPYTKPWNNAMVPVGYEYYKYKYFAEKATGIMRGGGAYIKVRLLHFISDYIIGFYNTDKGINIRLFHFLKTRIWPRKNKQWIWYKKQKRES